MRQGARTDLQLPANWPEVSQAKAADLLNVSERSIRRAARVIDHGAPELVAAVDAGEVAVSTAAAIATLPVAEQQEIVARGEDEIVRYAKLIRDTKAARDKRIFDLWLACWTQEEIAEAAGCSHDVVQDVVSRESADVPESVKPAASHLTDFQVPLYNVWKQQEKTAASYNFLLLGGRQGGYGGGG